MTERRIPPRGHPRLEFAGSLAGALAAAVGLTVLGLYLMRVAPEGDRRSALPATLLSLESLGTDADRPVPVTPQERPQTREPPATAAPLPAFHSNKSAGTAEPKSAKPQPIPRKPGNRMRRTSPADAQRVERPETARHSLLNPRRRSVRAPPPRKAVTRLVGPNQTAVAKGGYGPRPRPRRKTASKIPLELHEMLLEEGFESTRAGNYRRLETGSSQAGVKFVTHIDTEGHLRFADRKLAEVFLQRSDAQKRARMRNNNEASAGGVMALPSADMATAPFLWTKLRLKW